MTYHNSTIQHQRQIIKSNLSLSLSSRKRTNRCQVSDMVRQQEKCFRRSSTVALLILLLVTWTQQQQDHHHQQHVLVLAFTMPIYVSQRRIVTRKPNLGIVTLQRHHRWQEIVTDTGRRNASVLPFLASSRRQTTTSATQLAMNQQINQNENDDDSTSPLFYDDFDGFKSDDIYMTNAKDKTKATGKGMEEDENDDDDDSENDSIVNEDALGDWRSFRRKLATQERQRTISPASSASSSTVFDNSNKTTNGLGLINNNNSIFSSTTSVDDIIEQGEEQPQPSSIRPSSNSNKKASAKSTTTTMKKTKSPNELLFEQQNDKLAQEYYQDSWAHEIATVSNLILLESYFLMLAAWETYLLTNILPFVLFYKSPKLVD